MTTHTAEYLQGIKDGRAALKTDEEFGVPLSCAAARELAFIERVSSLAGSALHRDYLDGLRDFWNHQLTKDAQHGEATAELTRLLEDIEDMFDRVFILKEPPRDVAGLRRRVERALRP